MKNPNISLGQYLKEHREQKGLSIDEAAIETNIAKKYIEALENDEYGFFPAEMYVTGFLTAYIEILELDKELILSMYRRSLNKEQEAPLEVLYDLQIGQVKKYNYLLILGMVFIGILGIFFLIQTGSVQHTPVFTEKSEIYQVSITDMINDMSIKLGTTDTLVIMGNNNQTISTVEFLGKEPNKKQIHFKIAQNQYTYKNGDILNIDIDEVSNFKLEIIAINNNNIEVELQYTQQTPSFFDITPYRNAIINTTSIASVTNVNVFNAVVTATRPIWIAYQVDTAIEQQQMLNSGETVRFSFIDGARVSLGNAGAATITFSEFTNIIRGGVVGESSQSIFYKKTEANVSTLYRSQLK
ncbi:MAG: helix-turn-helix domain-containing protein [Brevinema sp.]